MSSYKVSVCVVLISLGYVSTAPKPFSFQEVGRKLHDFGQKALPAVRGVCGFVNAYQGYPQGYPPAYPQGYPQEFTKGYPQAQLYYPQISNSYPQVPNVLSSTSASSHQQVPSKNPSEQEDLINFDPVNNVNRQTLQIQDVLKNFDRLPKLDSPYPNGENNVLKHHSS